VKDIHIFFQLVLIFCKREKFQYLVPVNVEVYMIKSQLRHVCCVLDSRLEVQILVKVIVVVPWFVEYVVRHLRFYLKQYKPDVVQLYVYVFSFRAVILATIFAINPGSCRLLFPFVL